MSSFWLIQEVVRSFVLPGECDISPPHLTTPRFMLQILGSPIAGRETEKESGFDARESRQRSLAGRPAFSPHSPLTACVGFAMSLRGEVR